MPKFRKDLPERECGYRECGKMFKPKNNWIKYCDRECGRLENLANQKDIRIESHRFDYEGSTGEVESLIRWAVGGSVNFAPLEPGKAPGAAWLFG